ncbi:SusC/RagA family TonB-linked outer membrane protein [Arcticibacterium luteifluviistationis]|uniref:SusC/RagA family TonB-linked outer membrane protein n=1 Tax=Arcticibacterium luteifluviistationis TaxID=1784714 RepID=A0A2Z4GE91_9BACT|nr:SusC/RagA family TonB-linked outer membrane protein [Arcticibacterium luteifluviistationis]AWV99308.1 SusC/RagA family TonB-linked outer membrane protein [Arcticibacterium luteifluviistationis]
MKKKLFFNLTMTLLLFGFQIMAQNKEVTGTVTGNEGGLPGVSVILEGSTQGTMTNVDGAYSISVPANGTLKFSFIGYLAKSVKVNNQSVINVKLEEEQTNLSEVVVTALGIKREAKTLGYATATVNAEQVSTNRSPNVMTGLQGKMSGVNITTMGTGPGGSAKIRIRGQSSFSGQNNPLIIINGVPVDNTNYSLGGDYGSRSSNSSDGGDGLSSINPDDVESMTVLKGATAAALYGSRAKDGVVMITTKNKGSGKGFGVSYNMNFTTDTPIDNTDFQYEYGQGEGGKRPTSANPTSGVWSFGEKFEPGMTQILFDNEEYPYEPVYDRVKKFYDVGTNLTNTITVSNAGEKGGFSLSLSNASNKGIMPNNKFDKKIINLGFTQNITSKLTATGNVNYSLEDNTNPPQVNTQDVAVSTVIFTLANSMPFEALQNNPTHPNGDEFVFSRFLVRNNPYYSMSRKFENIDRNRLFGNIALKYQFTDWLYLQGRLSEDFYVRNQEYNIPNGYAPIPKAPTGYVNGSYTQDIRKNTERNLDFILGANRDFGTIGVDLTLGGNQRYARNDYNSVTVQDFVQPGLYTVMNGRVKDPLYALSEKKINSLFGATTISYKEFLYLSLTARNDWFSTLAAANRSILYPSATGSFVFSQAFNNLPSWLNFGKFRAAYAEVGSDNVNPYSNALYYAVDNNSFPNPSGQLVPIGGVNASVVPNRNLRPLRVKEAEFGIEMKIIENKVGLDFTYYNKITEDQILAAQISDATSYTSKLINVGRSRNQGIEAMVSFSPIKSGDFVWDFSANASYNTSEVLKLGLTDKDTVITVGGGGGRTLNQVVGKPIGQLYTFMYLRDDQGRQVFDSNSGMPLRDNTLRNVGNALPKYFGGITNTFRYKNIQLYTLIDFKLGHKLIAGRNINYIRHGLSKRTLPGRDVGYVIGDGVNQNGEINTTQVAVQPFYESINPLGINEDFVQNAGFWKLRQVSLSYDFTKLFAEDGFVKGLRLSAVANNVLTIKKWTENMDPEEALVSSDNAVGLDFWPGLPPTRSVGFNLNFKF